MTDAIPAAPVLAITDTVPPRKSSVEILPAVPTTTPSSLTVKPPIAPTPPAVIPVRAEPSPAKAGAVTVDPLKVKVPLSCNSPLFPTKTIRPCVKSVTLALPRTALPAVRTPTTLRLVNSLVVLVLIPGIVTNSAVPSPLKVPFKVVPLNVKLELS